MARFLAYTSPARGHLYPIAGVLLELRARGHEVHVRTLASELETLRPLGLHAEAIAADIEALPLDDWRWSSPEKALAGALRTFAERAPHEVGDLTGAIDVLAPDVLVIDTTTVGASAVAEASGLPWAQWIPFFQHFGAEPGRRIEVTRIPFTLPGGMDVLNAPRRALRMADVGPEDAYRAPLHLYFTAEPFEIEGIRVPASFRLVGPGLWGPPAGPPDWLADLRDPIVFVTASSEFQRDDALVAAALEALRHDDVRVVASTVAHETWRFDVPPNARLEQWLSHGAAMPRAACVVCHGGMGITQRALAAGVPVCVVPFGRDQPEVASRVASAGAGTWLHPDALSPAALRTAVREAMAMSEGARRIAAGFARAGGAPAAADALEALCSSPMAPAHEGPRAAVR